MLDIRADFTQAARVHWDGGVFLPSPLPGVTRLMLDRVGDELARATSLVRYAAGSRFSAHKHPGGEEFLVLEGIFSDERGDYPAGTYVRNPPGSQHTPHSDGGCLIFVKLMQFDAEDLAPVTINTNCAQWQRNPQGNYDVLPLHRFGSEWVQLIRLASGKSLLEEALPGGAELLVLEGEIGDASGSYVRHSWLRLPPGAALSLHAKQYSMFYLKTGHLG
jgi:anti-sigma factor ChrR (cupin superfamily)